MDKIEYVAKLYDLFVHHNEVSSPYIIPEYNEHLCEFIFEISEQFLGKDVTDLVYDVATEQCINATINDVDYPLTNFEELLKFIIDAKLL